MREYSITVTYTVYARDYDEAVEIAKAVCGCINSGDNLNCDNAGHGYRLRDVETSKIEEL